MQVPFVDLTSQHELIKTELHQSVNEVINSHNYILGNKCLQFEQEFAAYNNSKYCIGVGNGTDAIELSLRALGIGKGDKVAVPANTFAATLLAILYVGAEPVFVDCDTNSLISIDRLTDNKVKAVIPVHLYGQLVDIKSIKDSIGSATYIIEDGAQAQGASVNGNKMGSWGDIVSTSFYPTKNLGCLGDGGAILVNSSDLNSKLRKLRNYGSSEKYKHDIIGYNSRLDEIQAAILSVKLKYLDLWNLERRNAAKIYDELLGDLIQKPMISNDTNHVYHLYVITIPKRDLCIERLAKAGIETKIHYPIPLHMQQAFSFLNYKEGDFPNAEYLAKNIISLPMYPGIKRIQQEYVVDKIREHYESL